MERQAIDDLSAAIKANTKRTTLDDLKTYHRMLVETTDRVRAAMREGKSLDQIKAEGPGDEWKDWGAGFINADRWIETIHRSYSQ